MRKESFILITYQEFACEVLKTILIFFLKEKLQEMCAFNTGMARAHLFT